MTPLAPDRTTFEDLPLITDDARTRGSNHAASAAGVPVRTLISWHAPPQPGR